MKHLIEKRNDLVEEMEGLVSKAETETRAMGEEEVRRFDEIKAEIKNIDATLKAGEETRGLEKVEVKNPEKRSEEEIRVEVITKEERAFVDFLKGDTRALSTAGQNGVTIPLSIANKIVDKVVNLSPLLSKATVYNVIGDLSIPVYDYTQHLPSGYATELTTITAQAGTFTNVTLKNNIVVSLAVISKSLINRTDIDVVPFIVNEIAKALAHFLEKELVSGLGGAGKLNGLAQVSAGQQLVGATTLVITIQELINLQMKVPQAYQKDSAWIMHPNTLAYIQGLQAGAGSNLLIMGNSLSQDAPFTILGKPVYVSDNMPQIGVNALQIFYGDFSGLAVKMTKNVELQVLNERFADQYAIGVLGSVELDSLIAEPQKIVCYKGK
jgi:HK97 family phage major capsid protein